MKAKSINEIFEEINNMPQETYPSNYITGDEFEEWLKSKKNDSIFVNENTVGQYTGFKDKNGKEIINKYIH